MGKLLASWLNERFLELQRQSGARWKVIEFAEYLDCPQPQVSRWLSGDATPSAKYIPKLAKLGLEIYDLVGLPRPDPDLYRIAALWPILKEERRAYIVRLVEKAARDGQVSETTPRVVAKARQTTA